MIVSAWPKSKNSAYNPYQSLLYRAVERENTCHVLEFRISDVLGLPKADLLHIHWPDAYLAAGKGWRFWPRYILLRLLFAVASRRNIPIVWTAHNLLRDGQRNAGRMEKLFWPWFLSRIDGVVFMTKASRRKAFKICPRLSAIPTDLIPHGHYKPLIKTSNDKVEKGKASQVLFFGSITRYKNAYKLLESFLGIASNGVNLAIKGKMSTTEPDLILQEMISGLTESQKQRVIYDDRFLDDDELVRSIMCSDLVVFPYSDVLNSGAAIFALSVGCPILASDTPLFRELQDQVGNRWVQLIDGELDTSGLSEALINAGKLKELGAQPDLSPFDWDVIARQTLEFYQQVITDGANNKP